MISILLSAGGINPPLDGVTPVFEMTGADPSAGAGLDRPPGSVARFGANYFWKFGLDPTDWSENPFSSGGGGGITNVTGSSGIHVTGTTTKNVTNDLVTGDAVAQVNAVATGTITMTSAAAGGITISTSHATAGNINLTSAHGDINLTASDDGKILLHAAALAEVTGAGVRIVSNPASQLILGSGANTSLTVGGSFAATSGGNYSFTNNAASNGGFTVTADGTGPVNLTSGGTGQMNLTSGDAMTLTGAGGVLVRALGATTATLIGPTAVLSSSGASGTVNIQAAAGGLNITILNSGKFSIFGGAGDVQTAAIVNATGGTVQDSEARTAINALLAAMRLYGFVHT